MTEVRKDEEKKREVIENKYFIFILRSRQSISKMIIGHIGAGLIVQYFALRSNPTNRKLSASIPSWCTIIGATLSDIFTGTFILCGIETIRSNESIKPIGLSLVNIDWSHSFMMIILTSAAWATFCS